MSLSRPVEKFPLLKLPWLCIRSVIKRFNTNDIIFFALLSRKTRRIVKSFKIPLNKVIIVLTKVKWVMMNKLEGKWHFREKSEPLLDGSHQDSIKYPFVLQENALPLYTSKTDRSLESYTDKNATTALKMAMEFLNEVFNCSVEKVNVHAGHFPETGDIGVRSTINLTIVWQNSQSLGFAQSQKMSLLLEKLEVTGTCTFLLNKPRKDFYCDPKLFKCKKLLFWSGSAAWVTREILLQFEVPQLKFEDCPFSVEDILSFVTHWLHSDNKKLEYLLIYTEIRQFSLEDFHTEELNLVPFSGRTRVPPMFGDFDLSEGLEIVRLDGLHAIIMLEEVLSCSTSGIINESGAMDPHWPIRFIEFFYIFIQYEHIYFLSLSLSNAFSNNNFLLSRKFEKCLRLF